MSIFPKIQSPCPYKGDLSAIMDGDMCRLCKREVVDLSPMSNADRVAFLAGCTEQVCVSYKFPLRPAIAAALTVAALGAAMPAAAQDLEDDVIIVGGITDLSNIEYVTDGRDDAVSELPVVYEDAAPRETSKANVEPAPAPAPDQKTPDGSA